MTEKIRHYIKSALLQAKTDPLFTGIYIAGVTLTITTILTIATLYYIKIAPIYPETNRSNTYYIDKITRNFNSGKGMTIGTPSVYFLKEYIRPIDGVMALGIYFDPYGEFNVQLPDNRGSIPVKVKQTDDVFFQIVKFRFLEGEPFSAEDIAGEVKDIIITDKLAELIFGKGNTGYVGKTISIDFQDWRIKGVVESASPLTNISFAQIYMPYANDTNSQFFYKESDKLSGYSKGIMLIKEGMVETVNNRLKEQLTMLERKYASEGDTVTIEVNKFISHAMTVFAGESKAETWWEAIKGNIIVLLIVLFVPAMNLGSLISGRMDSRISELGIRKAFGASKWSIYNQILIENLVYTLIGGGLGLVISTLTVFMGKMALMKMIDSSFSTILVESASVTYRPEMFLSWTIFGAALAVCLVLNSISAIIPAYMSMRRKIVESINEKR